MAQHPLGKQLQDLLSKDPKEDWPALLQKPADVWRSLGQMTLGDIAEKGTIDYNNKKSIKTREGVNSDGKKVKEIGQMDGFIFTDLDGIGRRVIEDQIAEGQFKGGKMDGYGRVIFDNGNVYEGEHKDDKKHGKGKFVRNNGDVYEGEWKDDKRHGKGKFV